jgi:hypothetical protein
MNVERLVPHFAQQCGAATLTATATVARGGIRQAAQGGAFDHRGASIPGHIDLHGRPAADSSETTDTASLVMTGGIALALGLIVYLSDRNASHAALIPAVAALGGSNLFGALGQWLPAAVHPFAFSLFTAAALPSRSAWRYGACAAWCMVNITFELGQHPLVSGYLVGVLQTGSGQSAPRSTLASYFLHGTFDRADIVAAVLGALAAAVVLRRMQQVREKDHAS